MKRLVVVLSFVFLGALAVSGNDSREVKLSRTEFLAITRLNEEAQRIRDAKAEIEKRAAALDADTAAVISDIRLAHGILEGEEFKFDGNKGCFVVTPAPRPPETDTKDGKATR